MNKITPITAPRLPADTAKDAFDRLLVLGWRSGLLAMVAALATSFLLFGYAVIYWRNADMDFMVVYNALVLNDGKPQWFFDHTAYLTILSVQFWFRLLHALGLLDAYALSGIPSAANPIAFDAAMTSAVRAARCLVFLIATGSVLIFAGLIRPLVRDWRVAFLATLAFACSGGIAVHSRILRSELVAACPVIFALMILIAAGRRAHPARPLVMALAAALCVLGLENKVQAILLIGTLPLAILPFGSTASASAAFWRDPRSAWTATTVVALIAFAAVWAAWPLVGVGYDRSLLDDAHFRPVMLGRFGLYQAALLALTGACMICYAMIWRVSAAETLASMLAMAAGASIALLLLDLEYNADNVIAVFNPLEKMLTFADVGTANAAGGSSPWAIVLLVLDGAASALARYSFVLHSSARPTIFLTWLIVPGIVVAWRRDERQPAIQATALLLAAFGIDALDARRGLKAEYFIFSDPLIILSGAILLDRLSDLRFHRWAYPIAITLVALHIAVGQAEPVKYAFKGTGPESICQWNRYYLPLLPLPWCASPPVRP